MIKKLLLGAIMVTAFLLGCSVVEVGGPRNPYFPLAEGSTWVYEVSGNNRVDTLVCMIKKTNPGIYVWETFSTENPDSVSVLGIDIVDGAEPFDDSTRVRVDSLLSWGGARITLPLEASIVDSGDENVKTPAGIFNQCLLTQGEPDSQANRFDVWLAYDVGPVLIHQLSGDEIIRVYKLLNYQPAE